MSKHAAVRGQEDQAHSEAFAAYCEAGSRRAAELGNRGPIRFEADGSLHRDIVQAYAECGFYIFEKVIGEGELADLEREAVELFDQAPVAPGAKVDSQGRPALGADGLGGGVAMVRPLSDPLGGTAKNNGRHPSKMYEPKPAEDAPAWVPQIVTGSLQFSEAALRLYGHPDLLRVAAAFAGDDFSPFNEVIWYKAPRLGGSVAWHQDGTTHWDAADFHRDSHGFNFMAQLYGCNAVNGLWVVPGSHVSKADIKSWVDAAGSDQLPDAVPLLCGPGDVAITNRQTVHGSFPNTSDAWRITVNFGFIPRASVLGARGNGIHATGSEHVIYDAARIEKRSEVLGYAIAARSQKYPHEPAYRYQPQAGRVFEWNEVAKAGLRGYNKLDLGV